MTRRKTQELQECGCYDKKDIKVENKNILKSTMVVEVEIGIVSIQDEYGHQKNYICKENNKDNSKRDKQYTTKRENIKGNGDRNYDRDKMQQTCERGISKQHMVRDKEEQ